MKDFNAVRLDDKGEVDDVAITGDLFRMERMNDGNWWIAMYRNGQRTCFALFTADNSYIKATIIENDLKCTDDTPRNQQSI